MACGCNSICNADCSSNQLCTGHVPSCSNSFTFTSINAGDIVRESHLTELQIAIQEERVDSGRRFISSPPAVCTSNTGVACSNNEFSWYSFSSFTVNSVIKADHFNEIKDANNEVESDSGFGGSVVANFIAQSVDPNLSIIYASDITELQTKINITRNVCICDSHCNCNPSDCGCNGECPSDDAYYS